MKEVLVSGHEDRIEGALVETRVAFRQVVNFLVLPNEFLYGLDLVRVVRGGEEDVPANDADLGLCQAPDHIAHDRSREWPSILESLHGPLINVENDHVSRRSAVPPQLETEIVQGPLNPFEISQRMGLDKAVVEFVGRGDDDQRDQDGYRDVEQCLVADDVLEGVLGRPGDPSALSVTNFFNVSFAEQAETQGDLTHGRRLLPSLREADLSLQELNQVRGGELAHLRGNQAEGPPAVEDGLPSRRFQEKLDRLSDAIH